MSWVTKKMIKEWEAEWENMPEFVQEDLQAFREIRIKFETQKDVDAFMVLIGQKITPKTQGIWYPAHEKKHISKVYIDES